MLQLRLWALLGALLLAAAAGVFSAAAWMTQEAPVVDFAAARPRAQAQAAAIAEAWVEGRPTGFPTADGIDPGFSDGAGGFNATVHALTPIGWYRDSVTGRLVESHAFAVETDRGVYRLTVVLLLDVGSPTLAAYPVLSPYNGDGAGTEPLDYRSTPAVVDEVAAPVRERLERWATAYGINDGAELRDLADDRTATPSQYRGIGGLSLARIPEIVTAVSTTDGLVLRVRVAYRAPDATAALLMDFDLLVTGELSQTPRIVAWGPAGTGPDLQRYENRAG